MNVTCNTLSLILGQANAAGQNQSLLGWFLNTLSWSGLLSSLAGLAIFVGACVFVKRSRRPALIASYLILLPLPLIISLNGALFGQISSLAVLSIPNAVPSLTQDQIAGGVAGALVPIFVALLLTIPSYLVLAGGSILRTYQAAPR